MLRIRPAAFLAAFCLLFFALSAVAQSTLSTGSIQGTITDPSGAVVPNAKVIITNRATGKALTLSTNSNGFYHSGPLAPADYDVRVENTGFSTVTQPVAVQVAAVSSVNVALTVGKESQVIEVTSGGVAVNTEQATVQGVLTAKQIETLPLNGRNFLDLAQLEPGVQIQDGSTFDPTKAGYSSLSFGGRYGRAARIMVDGVDISDETVGTTTQNIPESAIAEFQVAQSSLDVSTEVTSTGTVNVVTKSGTNQLHGDAFYYGRSNQTSARIAPITPTQP